MDWKIIPQFFLLKVKSPKKCIKIYFTTEIIGAASKLDVNVPKPSTEIYFILFLDFLLSVV